jgi:hypothetical protein
LVYVFGIFKIPRKGAEKTLFLANNNDYESGKYWHKSKKLDMKPISNYSKQVIQWAYEKLGL